jgi:RNA polymerase I-specific transcription initiation factor RRN7
MGMLYLILRFALWLSSYFQQTVVKDLWTLRLAKQAEKLSSVEPQDQGLSRNAGTSDESEKETSNVPTPPGKKARDSPVLVETIALCYLGILLLRLPIGLGDIYRYNQGHWIRRHAAD